MCKHENIIKLQQENFMSIAHFIVLDNEEVDFDTFVNGKSIAHVYEELNNFCKKHELKTIEDFQYFGDLFEDFDVIETSNQETKWLEAKEGIDWATSLINKLESKSTNFDIKPVVNDLNEYLAVFQNAAKVDAKWYFELDY